MSRKKKCGSHDPPPNVDIGRFDFVANSRSGAELGLMKSVLDGLTNCHAELRSLQSPWVSLVPEGWFHVYCVRAGTCQLILEGFAKPFEIQSGDTVILPRCRAHRLRDSSTTEWSDSIRVSWFEETPNLTIHRYQESPPVTKIFVSRFRKPIRESDVLLNALPEYLISRNSDPGMAQNSESIVPALVSEVAQFPASERIVEHLVKALVLQTARQSEDPRSHQQAIGITQSKDWVVVKALALMHSRLELAWTVASLATAVGVSRSTFATRFVEQVGVTPLSYLRRERMNKAAELLCDERLGIKNIATSVGYDSESAFSHAFKHWSGLTPGSYRSDRKGSA